MRIASYTFRELKILIATNGVWWTFYQVCKVGFSGCSTFFETKQKLLEQAYTLPGDTTNSIIKNKRTWDEWDWSDGGEIWTTPEAKSALVEEVLLPFVHGASSVIEIGPGAGKWTEFLQQQAQTLWLVDVSTTCLELCKQRFAACNNIHYVLNSGCDLPSIPDSSVDCIWSYDVFVHIEPHDIQKYILEFTRVLKPGGTGMIMHADHNGAHGGWRTPMTAEKFVEFLSDSGLHCEKQVRTWGNGAYEFGHKDVMTFFKK